jgi:hypothetical protein
MCIDEEYFLDGDIDCQDRSDEKIYDSFWQSTCFKMPNLNCDEAIMPNKASFSCGDGQIVPENAVFLQGDARATPCFSYREKQWMCELDDVQIMWTNPQNGHCLEFVDETLGIEEAINNCLFIMKCSLSRPGQHYLCKCTGNGCDALRFAYCGQNENLVIPYPVGPIFTPFVLNLFHIYYHDYDRDRHPDIFTYIRPIKCYNGMAMLSNNTKASSYIQIAEDSRLFERLTFELDICFRTTSFSFNKSNNGNCWNDSYLNQATQCPRSPAFECVSKYQINDDIKDCIIGKVLYLIFFHCSNMKSYVIYLDSETFVLQKKDQKIYKQNFDETYVC